MKYIIDDAKIDELCFYHFEFDDYEGRGLLRDLTPVPELPVKRWEDIDRSMYGLQKDCMAHEITELRALCQAQAARIVEVQGEPVAWRYHSRGRSGDWLDWHIVEHKPQGPESDRFQMQPLFAHPMTWVSVEDRMPEPGTDCLVYVKGHFIDASYVDRDTWNMQREAPVSFSSVTIETGLAWNEHEFEDVLYWMAIPTPPNPACAEKPGSNQPQQP